MESRKGKRYDDRVLSTWHVTLIAATSSKRGLVIHPAICTNIVHKVTSSADLIKLAHSFEKWQLFKSHSLFVQINLISNRHILPEIRSFWSLDGTLKLISCKTELVD